MLYYILYTAYTVQFITMHIQKYYNLLLKLHGHLFNPTKCSCFLIYKQITRIRMRLFLIIQLLKFNVSILMSEDLFISI